MRIGKAIFVMGLRRSGNHALHNWLKPCLGECWYVNDSKFKLPFRYSQRLSEGSASGRFSLGKGFDCALVGVEDWPLSSIKKGMHAFNKAKRAWGVRFDSFQFLVLLRDPFNNFASVVRHGDKKVMNKTRDKFVALWKEYARECLGLTRCIPNMVPVLYNRWFESAEYRKAIAERMGIEYSDQGLQVVTREGQGSSFDGLSCNGNASSMNVNRRYVHFWDNDAFWKEIADEELVRLFLQLFPEDDRLRSRATSLVGLRKSCH